MRSAARAAALLFVSSLVAAGKPQAAEWAAGPPDSKLTFTGSQTGQPFTGRFDKFTATISFDPAQPGAGHADVTIDLGSAASGDPQRDTALPQAEWFNTGKFSQAALHIAAFTSHGGDTYEGVGKLTIKGVSVDLPVPFRVTINGDTAHATGHVDLLRNAFGIGQGPWATEDFVAFKVGVDFDLLAHKAP